MNKAPYLAGLALFLAAGALKLHGQPTAAERWEKLAPQFEPMLSNREVQIDPAELLDLMHDDYVNLIMLDVREESCYNIFHLEDSMHISLHDLQRYSWSNLPAMTVIVTMSNDETHATQAWRTLKQQHVTNAYILEGGINNWLDVYGHDEHHQFCEAVHEQVPDETLRHKFLAALGHRQLAAYPKTHHVSKAREYIPKVKLAKQEKKSGGCG